MWIKVALKVIRVTGLIAKLRYFVPTHTLLTIYRSFIAPHPTYGLVAWDQVHKSSLDKQKWALHFIYFSNRNQHAIPLFVDANILPLTFSYYESIAKLMYDVQHGISPKSIEALFEYVSGILQYNTRSSESHNFYIKHSRLSIHANSFSRIRAKLWNEIPLSLRNLSKNAFDRKTKENLTSILNAMDYYIDVFEIFLKMKSFFAQNST